MGEAADLLGRTAELDQLAALVASISDSGAAQLVLGEPGAGKTALLEAASKQAVAAGITVLGTVGVEFAVVERFGTLGALLRPLHLELARLTEVERDALSVALGLRPGTPPPGAVVCAAALALIRQAAQRQPLLVTVDDAQWLDRGSAEVLAYVARRLPGSRVGFIAVQRAGTAGPLTDSGLPELELQPLRTEQADQLLLARFPQMAPSARARVIHEAAGMPLALLEIPLALTGAQRAGATALPATIPVGHRLGDLYGSRIRSLSPRARSELLLAALDGQGGHLGAIRRATPEDPELLGIAEAETTGLVRVDDVSHRVEFSHPLVRATVVDRADPQARRAAHLALAHALPERSAQRVWHLAGAADAPDEAVADLLEQHAISALAVGDVAGAMAALERSAELSSTASARARRQLQAAFIGADVSGDLARAAELLEDAERLEPAVTGSLAATVTASYLLLNRECDVDRAHQLLVTAIENHPGRRDPTDRALNDALHSLIITSWFGGRAKLWVPFREALGRLGGEVPADVDLCYRMFADPAHQAVPFLEQLDRAMAATATELDPIRVTRVALAGVYTDRIGPCRPALWRVINDGREGGAVALAINALVTSCVDDWLTGQWDEAVELATAGTLLCDEHGYGRYSVILGSYISQLVAICRGDLDGGEEAATQMAQLAAERGPGMLLVFAHHLRTLRALAVEDYETAFAEACAISPPGALADYAPHTLWCLLDVVEAAVRTGRLDAARAHVNAMRSAEVDRISPRLAMLTAGAAALTADDDIQANEMFLQAMEVADGRRWPFDRARIQLAYSERLRHQRDPELARTVLLEAMDTFEHLSAQPWVRRTSRQLRAAGVPPRPSDRQPDAPELTGAEYRVAQLAASGLTNRQIGEQLFLSHRTIGAILYRIFPKLGVTSRAALRDALRGLADPADG